jgi:large subunit ribosomal protein L19
LLLDSLYFVSALTIPMNDLLNTLAREQLKADLPEIRPGDTVRVSVRVVEGNRERLQNFEGTVLRVRNGGVDKQITVRRIASGIGVERTFMVHSPRVEKIELVRHGHARRAALYFLRDRVGKAATLREKRR